VSARSRDVAARHTKRFLSNAGAEKGWEVREDLKRVWYTDWHRVERAMHAFNHHSELSRFHESISQAHHGLNLLSGRAELRSQPAHVHVY